MRESAIMKRCLLALGEAGILALRNNTGMGWAGQAIQITRAGVVTVGPGDVVIRNAFPLRAGLGRGGGDIVTCHEGQFGMVECKTETGRPSGDQRIFSTVLQSHGGYYGIARTPEEAVMVATGKLKNI